VYYNGLITRRKQTGFLAATWMDCILMYRDNA